jgi:hypothetical protein
MFTVKKIQIPSPMAILEPQVFQQIIPSSAGLRLTVELNKSPRSAVEIFVIRVRFIRQILVGDSRSG